MISHFKAGDGVKLAQKVIFLLCSYIEDVLIVAGLFCIIRASFLVSQIVGMYVLGGVLLFVGLAIAAKAPSTGR